MRHRSLCALIRAGAVAGILVVACGPTAKAAGVTITAEAAGVQYSTRSGTVVETFDSMSTGISGVINSSIGTYTAGGYISPANTWGGSNQTKYLAVGAQSSPTTTVTLTLLAPAKYFGFYLGALDGQNNIDIYDGANLLATLNIQSLSGLLGNSAYSGNPNFNPKINTGEKYAFLNVDADPGYKITSVVFRNLGTGTGLESDSHTVVNAVPEPSSLVALGMGLAGVGGFVARRRRARTQA